MDHPNTFRGLYTHERLPAAGIAWIPVSTNQEWHIGSFHQAIIERFGPEHVTELRETPNHLWYFKYSPYVFDHFQALCEYLGIAPFTRPSFSALHDCLIARYESRPTHPGIPGLPL